VLVNGEKMSKSLGNFMTVDECVKLYGADATRIALADAGDTLDDANFVPVTADNAILRLSNLEVWIKSALENKKALRDENTVSSENIKFVDNVFAAEIDRYISITEKAYESMRFRDVLKHGLFEFSTTKEDYKIRCGEHNMRFDLVVKYVETQLMLLYPICPHFAEIVYRTYLLPAYPQGHGKPELFSLSKWHEVDPKKIDNTILGANDYLKALFKNIRLSLEKLASKNKGKEVKPFQKIEYCTETRVL